MNLFGKKAVFTYGNESRKKEKDVAEPEAALSQQHFFGPEDSAAANDFEPKIKKTKPAKRSKRPKQKAESYSTYKPRLSGRGVFGILAIVIALFLLLVVSPLVTRMVNEEMGIAIRAVTNISKGSMIDAVNLEVVEVPVKSIPSNAIRAITEIAGFFAAADISEGDFLLESKLSDTLPFKDEYLYTIPDELFAMSVRIKSFENGLAGKLLSGDVVCVYASMATSEKDDSYLAAAPPELRYVRVLSITTGTGSDYDRNSLEKNLDDTESELPVTVELLVSERQARALAGLNQNAVIHLALASRGSPAHAEHLLALQNEFLEQQDAIDAALEEEKTTQGIAGDAEAVGDE